MLKQIKTHAECDIALGRVYKLMQEKIAPNSKEILNERLAFVKYALTLAKTTFYGKIHRVYSYFHR